MRIRTNVAVVVAAGALLAIGSFSGVADAGDQPTATADASCEGGEGFINVSIVDDSSEVYDVFIDDELVDEEVTDTDGGVFTYGPYENGVHNVVVVWFPDGPFEILNVDVTVDCEPVDTTSTTEAPTTTAGVAPAAQPRFTG